MIALFQAAPFNFSLPIKHFFNFHSLTAVMGLIFVAKISDFWAAGTTALGPTGYVPPVA